MIILSKVLKESNQFKILAIKVAAKRTLDNALLLIRISREILQEQIDGSTAMDGEHTFFHNDRHQAEKKFHLLCICSGIYVGIIHIQRVP